MMKVLDTPHSLPIIPGSGILDVEKWITLCLCDWLPTGFSPAQQLSWCRHHSKLSARAWIFAVLTPSNNNTNIFIVIMLDIFKVNAICWIHWHWALNLPGNLTSMNWLLSGLPDCHGLGPGPPRSSEAANFRLCFHKHSELLSSYFSKLAGRVAGHGTFPSNLSNV